MSPEYGPYREKKALKENKYKEKAKRLSGLKAFDSWKWFCLQNSMH